MRLIILIILSFCSANFSFADEASYGALAKAHVQHALKNMCGEITVLDADVQPHETKNLRKLIVAVREQLDLFVYAYPYSKKTDLWLEIRRSLDEGYETIGSFKDLYDTQHVATADEARYDAREVQNIRNDVLKWKKKWDENAESYMRYMLNPEENEIHERKKKDLSRFYWGASELTPDLSQSGLANLKMLIQDLVHSALANWQTVRNIKNPAKNPAVELEFHDLRKRLRSIARIIRTSPELYSGSEEDLVAIEELVGRYGEIEDLIVTHLRLEKQNKDNKAEEIYEEIKDLWKQLRREQEEMGFEELLGRINGRL